MVNRRSLSACQIWNQWTSCRHREKARSRSMPPPSLRPSPSSLQCPGISAFRLPANRRHPSSRFHGSNRMTASDPARPLLYTLDRSPGPLMEGGTPATAAAEAMEATGKAKNDGVVKEVIRLERESVIPIIKPKLVMKLAYLIGISIWSPIHCRAPACLHAASWFRSR